MTSSDKTGSAPPLQEALLEALERCFDSRGLKKTTLGAVAKEAGVSRMTVYRYFKDRDELFEAATMRNIRRQWETVAAMLPPTRSLAEWLLEAMLAFHRVYQDHDLVELYSRIGGHNEGLQVALEDPGIEAVARHFRARFAQRDGAPPCALRPAASVPVANESIPMSRGG